MKEILALYKPLRHSTKTLWLNLVVYCIQQELRVINGESYVDPSLDIRPTSSEEEKIMNELFSRVLNFIYDSGPYPPSMLKSIAVIHGTYARYQVCRSVW